MGSRVVSRTTVGHDATRRALDALLADAAGGEAALATIGGEAGIGKTRVTEELEEKARNAGFRVLHGECIEFGGDELPYAPILAALRDLPTDVANAAIEDLPAESRDELAALLPRLSSTGASSEGRWSSRFGQGRLYELILELMRRVAPVLIVFEDMHWADRSSRDFMSFFARNARSGSLLLVATYRTEGLPRAHPLHRLLAELRRRAERLELRPLRRDEVAAQIEGIVGAPVRAALVDELHARSGGNPFFVEELLAARQSDQDRAVPSTLADVVLARIEALPESAHELLGVVAAAGGRITFDLLERVAPSIDVTAALRAALDAHILEREPDDAAVVCRHALIGEVVYERLLPHERRELHRAMAAALAETPDAEAGQLAYHWHMAGARPQAYAASITAGLEAARVYAFAEARRHFERALTLRDCADAAGVDQVELLEHAAQAARYTGDAPRAVELCEQALRELDPQTLPVRAAMLHERLGEYHFWDDGIALACYGRALTLLPPTPSPERARLLAAQGHALMGLRRCAESRERLEEALAVAQEVGAARSAARARVTLGVVLALLGEPEAGERVVREGLESVQELGASEDLARAYIFLGEVLRLRGDYAGALDTMVAGEEVAARFGMRRSFGNFMFVNAADDLLRIGRWDELDQRLGVADRLDLALTGMVMRHTIAGHLSALRGDVKTAEGELEQAAKLMDDGWASEFVTPLASAWAALELSRRPATSEAARRHVDEALRRIGESKDALYTPQLLFLGIQAEVEIAKDAAPSEDDAAGAWARAEELLVELDSILDACHEGGIPPEGLAHRALARAELSRLSGEPDLALWRSAVAAFDALDQRHPAAYARFRAAEVALESRASRSEAAELLREARKAADAMGAKPLLGDIEELSLRARVDSKPPAAAAAARDEEDPLVRARLSPRETEILILLAEGLTNREIGDRLFISDRTVNAHLTNLFAKLNVHSRVEASGWAYRAGVVKSYP